LYIEVESWSTIEFNAEIVTIDHYLTGDWKFLALITGIEAATSAFGANVLKINDTRWI
jgi:hypothetical protein